jgi:hypothetical protein
MLLLHMQVRLEAAHFIKHFCADIEPADHGRGGKKDDKRTGFTRKMFIACGGLSVLVKFLDVDTVSNLPLVHLAIDCIRLVFRTTTNPKNDFYRLFCKFSLLPHLCRTYKALIQNQRAIVAADPSSGGSSNNDLTAQSPMASGRRTARTTSAWSSFEGQSIQDDDDAESRTSGGSDGLSRRSYEEKVAFMIFWFSQGDAVVKLALAQPNCIGELLEVINHVPLSQLTLLVKALRNVSMVKEENGLLVLDALERAGTITQLVPLLAMKVAEVHKEVLMFMYNMCKVSPSRQEAMAAAGIIPHLQRVVRDDHPLKQFALEIIKYMATCSSKTRFELKKYGGVEYFLHLLDSLQYWQVPALDGLVSWLSDDVRRVEMILAQPKHLVTFVHVLQRCPAKPDSLLKPLLRLLKKLPKLTRLLSDCAPFTVELLKILQLRFDPVTEGVVRKNLLEILTALFNQLPSETVRVDFITQHQLVRVLGNLQVIRPFL